MDPYNFSLLLSLTLACLLCGHFAQEPEINVTPSVGDVSMTTSDNMTRYTTESMEDDGSMLTEMEKEVDSNVTQACSMSESSTRNSSLGNCTNSNNTDGANSTDLSCHQVPNNYCGGSNNSAQNGTDPEQGKTASGGRRRPRVKLSKEDHEFYMSIVDPIRFALHVLVIPVLFLTVVAFARDRENSTSNKFIVTINLFEMVSSIFNLVYYSLKYALGSTAQEFATGVIVTNYLIVCCRRVVYILNLLLSSQRLFAVTAPLQSRQSLLRKFQNLIFVGVPLFMFIFHVYLLVMFKSLEIMPGVFILDYTDLYKEKEEVFNNLGHFTKTAFSYIPLLLTIGVNFALIRVLRQHSSNVKAMRTSKDDMERSKQDRQVTLMILVSTLAYTVLSLPPNLNQMYSTFHDTYGNGKVDSKLYSLVKTIVNGTQTIGDLTNFLTYLCLSTSFKHQLLQTLLPGRKAAVYRQTWTPQETSVKGSSDASNGTTKLSNTSSENSISKST